ncbi:hypothetical protein GGR52DRAFT_583703 [Hypoxylon sp. FL1284]|nr:hypothetical protein GGR52DRAFT_583703 [Hypoxylon sp. FL1284]
MAIVGFGCRLPGGNTSPQKLWDFLERGDVASNAVPKTRFNIEGHHDGSLKPKTIRQPGGMFLDNIELSEFDAAFFEIGRAEAVSMDPNQRQLLEVAFEGLENAGITLEDINGQPVGCFVWSYACDYADMQNRDPEDRPSNNNVGVARALLANRLSHFLNIKGPSFAVDTACSGSMQSLDVAYRYLQSEEINAAIVAASNLYMGPEHLITTGLLETAYSPTALCHAFDVAADGYVKAEAVSALIVKRLDDAIADRSPIRAILLGTATTSNGRTLGIASPNAASQALAIAAAYRNAGILDLNQTTYLEAPNHVSSYTSGDDGLGVANDDAERPSIVVLSASSSASLRAGIQSLANHLTNPRVQVSLSDLAYTLSERRTKFWHRAFITTQNTELDDRSADWTMSKESSQAPVVGFVFTGQGSQWPQMGKDLQFFPSARKLLEELDHVLRNLRHPPSWSLVGELTEPRSSEHLRQPEFSQTLTTALQLCIIDVLETWGIQPHSVAGHSSGEIAAAYAAGLLDRAGAIKASYYRGKAAVRQGEVDGDVGMLAVGLGADATCDFLQPYAEQAWIACFNSPSSVTVSGRLVALEALRRDITAAGHFARRLQVNMAYHTKLMGVVGDEYETLLNTDSESCASGQDAPGRATMFSSVTGSKQTTATTPLYWKQNLMSPVRFDDALRAMLSEPGMAPNFLVEVGPSGALAGPISQVLQSIGPETARETTYRPAWSRGASAGKSLFDVAGHLWTAGHAVNLAIVNQYGATERTIVDLPGYSWDHTRKYWHENAASKDWRFRKYVAHDLLGSKILGTSWHSPAWRSRLNVENVPFLMDHRIGGNAIMPGVGFITMALEALYQKHCAVLEDERVSNNTARNDFSYRFRNIRFLRSLVLEKGKDVMILLNLTAVAGSKDWHEFRISTSEGGTVLDHCSGSARIQDPVDDPAEGDNALPLKSPQTSQLWYKWPRDVGTDFGSAFQKLISVEAIMGERVSNTLLSLEPAESKYNPQSYYPIHPTALDGCIQTPFPAISCGDRTSTTGPAVPSIIDDLVINRVPSRLYRGRSNATAVYSGRGRLDSSHSWIANTSVHDAESGQLVVRITGMHYAKLDMAPKPDLHTFHRIDWKPDVSLITQGHVIGLTPQSNCSRLDTVLGLIAHKNPSLRILELNFDETDSSCIWSEKGSSTTRAAYSTYAPGATGVRSLVDVQTLYNLIIVKTPDALTNASRNGIIEGMMPLLAKESFLLIVEAGSLGSNTSEDQQQSAEVIPAAFQSSSGRLSSPISSPVGDEEAAQKLCSVEQKHKLRTITFATTDDGPSVYLLQSAEDATTKDLTLSSNQLIVARLCASSPEAIPPSFQSALETSGWDVTHLSYPFSKPSKRTVILVMDELWSSVLSQIESEQWEAVKTLIDWGNPLLWITEGAQGAVTNPDSAMINGLFRVARREDPGVKLTTLDVHSKASPASAWAVDTVLGRLRWNQSVEAEYMERDGMMYVQRIIPDDAPVVKGLHSTDAHSSLTWCETETEVPELGAGTVEIEVVASGVNFKDVLIIMGIVPDDEYTLGAECAGVIRRLGPGVDKFTTGDRVCAFHFGTFANRVRVPVDRCHIIPAAMTFEEAATIPLVYLCSLYAMYHLGGLREGQSVLIHSAAGGVGIACIELALHKKAEIFVTVGTEEKRQFLNKTYGISPSHTFSSRNAQFAAGIMKATNGRGVDVIINSLAGELLDASWRILADGGNMVEIGKKDILDRNTLSMEPFDRNCSFRALDLSYVRHVKDQLISSLFDELFVLFNAGVIKPVNPITTFGFDNVTDALSRLRSGRHIGKIALSNNEKADIQLPIRPAVRRLRLDPNVSYVVVGGLRGACGILAIHMARHGARHILVISRSGISDEASKRILASCKVYNCDVSEARGDVGDADFVRRTFKSVHRPIAGTVQGAMVVRDKPLEPMTLDDFRMAIHAKVEGTKNLHQASEETQKQPLQFFTMLSSIAGIIGNKGQSNYAAANAFLDAFASYRQSLGLRAHSIDLGVIEDIGYVAEQGSTMASRFDRRFFTPINEAILCKILTYSILQQDDSAPLNAMSRTQMITGIGYPLPSDASESLSDPRFGFLFNSRAAGDDTTGEMSDDGNGGQVDQAIQRFRLLRKSGGDTPNLKEACLEMLSAQVNRTLGLETDLDADRSLAAYGLDSLSAVDLRNWICTKLGAELSTLDVNTSSLVALCEKLISKLPPLQIE